MNIPKLSLCLLAMLGTMHMHAQNVEVFNGSADAIDVAFTTKDGMIGQALVYKIKAHHKITIPFPTILGNDAILLFSKSSTSAVQEALESNDITNVSYYRIGKKGGKIFIGPLFERSKVGKGVVLARDESLTIYPTYKELEKAELFYLKDNGWSTDLFPKTMLSWKKGAEVVKLNNVPQATEEPGIPQAPSGRYIPHAPML